MTVRLLSGERLLALSVGDHLQASELRVEVEVNANLAAGTCIRTLLWGSRELEGARTLRELGMCGAEEVVAVCARAIEGDFERFRPGCPTCDHNAVVTRMRFELSGVASLSTSCQGEEERRLFRYTLGEVEEGGVPGILRRGLCLEELLTDGKHDGEAVAVFEGCLEFDATDPIQRRVRVGGLSPDRGDLMKGLDLEDLRALRRRGEDEAQVRVQMLYLYHFGGEPPDGEGEGLPDEDSVFLGDEMRDLRSVFARPRCKRERFRREQRPKPKHRRRNHCFCGLACQGRGSHWNCFRQGDVRAAAALVRSRTRRAERDFKIGV